MLYIQYYTEWSFSLSQEHPSYNLLNSCFCFYRELKVQNNLRSVERSELERKSNLYHLRQSFEFYDSSGTKLALSTDNITGLLSDYKYGYYKIAKGGDEITYSYVLLKIKNNLPQSTYSALFHMYG